MFAQGQLLGMQTDLLNRLKVKVNAWEKVAEKHPCAAQLLRNSARLTAQFSHH